MTESGNPYDEFVDESKYFVLYPDHQTFILLELKIKKLKTSLGNEANGKVTSFLSEHKYEPVNESFLIGLVNAMNQ